MAYKANWRHTCNAIHLRLWKILIRHRDHAEIANIENLLTHCPSPADAVLQWARANVPNIAIGEDLRWQLGPDDIAVRRYLDALQRKSRGKYLHLVWP